MPRKRTLNSMIEKGFGVNHWPRYVIVAHFSLMKLLFAHFEAMLASADKTP